MAANIIDGKAYSDTVRSNIAREVADLIDKGIQPGLAVVLVGEDPASKVYVRNKARACKQTGIVSSVIRMPADTPQYEIIAKVRELNADPAINGILVQLPLPDGIDEDAVLREISPDKDVDGFHPVNVGRMVLGQKCAVACTPAGCLELIKSTGINLRGTHAVVVGRSNIVGKPMAMLLLQNDCTVTMCHSRTVDLASYTKSADILVVAVGRPRFITGDMIKPGAVVIDVGINRTDDGLVGDVDYDSAAAVAGYITPVPGGVGPMTITGLLANTVTAARLQNGLE